MNLVTHPLGGNMYVTNKGEPRDYGLIAPLGCHVPPVPPTQLGGGGFGRAEILGGRGDNEGDTVWDHLHGK